MVEKVQRIARGTSRLDFVFETQTREDRGKGFRVAVRKETPICKRFQEFMRNDDDKTELFRMLAESLITTGTDATTIVATELENAASNSFQADLCNIQPCNHEEADTRLFLHVIDASNRGYKKIITVVVVIALHHFFTLCHDKLWVEIWVGQHRRWLPIHIYAAILKEEICRALPFWFTVTGCGTVSMFAGRGKKTSWKVWQLYPEATETFLK